MLYFMDSEFIEDGKTIDLISIGIVSSDGRELYAQSMEFDASKANEWVAEHVLEKLIQCDGGTRWHHDMYARVGQWCMGRKLACGCPWRTREQIKHEILAFMDAEKYGKPELWGYYSSYDHVVFAQLFGTMMDLPEGYPMLTYDLRQWLDLHGMKDIHQPDDSIHNALLDARWVAETYRRLVK